MTLEPTIADFRSGMDERDQEWMNGVKAGDDPIASDRRGRSIAMPIAPAVAVDTAPTSNVTALQRQPLIQLIPPRTPNAVAATQQHRLKIRPSTNP